MLYITRCHWTMDTVLVKENAYKFCYHGLAMYAHTVERVSKLLKFFWGKRYTFQQLDTPLCH